MTILALDLSVRGTGYCVGAPAGPYACGTRAFSARTIGDMLNQFYDWLEDMIRDHGVTFLCFEQPVRPFAAANLDTMRKLYSLAGVAEMVAQHHGVRVRECNNATAKKIAYGNGRFTTQQKKQHGVSLIRTWPGFEPDTHDSADACAVFITTLKTWHEDEFCALNRRRDELAAEKGEALL